MAQDGKFRILHAHALAVIGNAHEAGAAGHDLDFDTVGASIHRIFYQLFDDRRRPFYHLTGSNLVDGIIVQNMDKTHACPASLFACSCSL